MRLRCMRCGDWHEPPPDVVAAEICPRCFNRFTRACRKAKDYYRGAIWFLDKYRKNKERHPTWEYIEAEREKAGVPF